MGFGKNSTYKGRTGELRSEVIGKRTRLTAHRAFNWDVFRYIDCSTQADFDKAYSLLAPIVDIPDYGTYRRGA